MSMPLPIREWFAPDTVNALDPDQVESFYRYIWNQYGVAFADHVMSVMNNDWSLVNGEGKLATRLTNGLKKLGYPTPNTLLDRLSRHISQAKTAGTEYCITNKLDWNMGDYGDDGSCFFTFNRRYRAYIVNAGGGAILAREPGSQRGLGRAFLLPMNDHILMFNRTGGAQSFNKVLLSVLGEPFINKGNKTDVRMSADVGLDDGKREIGFYTNGDTTLFGPPDKDFAPINREKPVMLDGCRCARLFNALPHQGAAECLACPFSQEERDRFEKNPDPTLLSWRRYYTR